MIIASWNVNSLRALIRKGALLPSINKIFPDILCLQETKVNSPIETPLDSLYPYRYWSFNTNKKGYCGVAIFSKHRPLRVLDTPHELSEFADEGRFLAVEFEAFIVVTVYVVNSGQADHKTGRPGLHNLHRREKWDACLASFVKHSSKPLIVIGDFNVAPVSKNQAASGEGIDYFNNNNPKAAGLTAQEIAGYHTLLNSGLVDTYRHLYPTKTEYTYYNYLSRKKTSGWRIDFALASTSLMKRVADSEIHGDVSGSDHKPISLILH